MGALQTALHKTSSASRNYISHHLRLAGRTATRWQIMTIAPCVSCSSVPTRPKEIRCNVAQKAIRSVSPADRKASSEQPQSSASGHTVRGCASLVTVRLTSKQSSGRPRPAQEKQSPALHISVEVELKRPILIF